MKNLVIAAIIFVAVYVIYEYKKNPFARLGVPWKSSVPNTGPFREGVGIPRFSPILAPNYPAQVNAARKHNMGATVVGDYYPAFGPHENTTPIYKVTPMV